MKKKRFTVILLLIILSFQLVSAVEFNLKENFLQGETLMTKISGNFINPLTKDNIFFYEGHVRIPVEYDIEKINNDYYLYAVLSGKAPGNYSVSIENTKYMKGTDVVEDDIIRNFSIMNEMADFSLKPGFIVSSEDFSVEIQNLQDNQITLDIKTPTSNISERDISILMQDKTSKTLSLSVVSGEIKKIYFRAGYGSPTFQIIELKTGNFTYELPVYIFSSSINQEVFYKLDPSQMILSLPTNSITKKVVFLYNTGDKAIKNISFSFSDSISPFVNLSQDYIETLSQNNNFPIELSFFSSVEKEISGTLKADLNGEEVLYSQLSLKFLNNYVPVNETAQSSSVKTCSELSGKICSTGQTCDKEIVYAKDNVCCLGNCKSASKKSSAGKIIAIIICIVLIVGGIWFYKKRYKKAKKPVDLIKEAKGKKLVSFWAKR